MSTVKLSRAFGYSSDNPNFAKVDKRPFEIHLSRLNNLPLNDHDMDVKKIKLHPIPDSCKAYISTSDFDKLRHTCIKMLGTLPEHQDNVIREFLSYSVFPEEKTEQKQRESSCFFPAAARYSL